MCYQKHSDISTYVSVYFKFEVSFHTAFPDVCHFGFPSTRYSLYSMKTCLPRKASKPRNVEHFYSSGPRPTLRMVDGDIVVVSPNGRVVRQQAPGDQTTLETSDNSHVQVQVTPQNENRARTSERIAPEIPFHLVPPPEGQSTLSSGTLY